MIRRASLKSLAVFTQVHWHTIEPATEYKHGWHIDAICDHLEACARFEIKQLLINVPPRHMKSILTNVMFPAWVWAHEEWAGRRFICGSYARDLSVRDGLKMRTIVESPLYKELYQPRWKLREDQNQKLKFENTEGGFRFATSVEGQVTGEGGDFLIVDDPLNAMEARSQVAREGAIFWIDKVLATRVNNPKEYAKIMIMQRLHEDDPAGHVLKNKGQFGRYERLILPARFEENRRTRSETSLNFKDPRTKDGELLWPEQFDDAALKALEASLRDEAQGQLQQDPKPRSGGLFKSDWWRRYDASPSQIYETVQFWDCAQKPGITNDYSVCATWAKTPQGFYLLDLWRQKVEAPMLEAMAVHMFQKWKPDAIVIEDKSAGSSLIQYLRRHPDHRFPVLAFNPERDKEVRASAATPTVQAGNCILPNREILAQDDEGNSYDVLKAFIAEHERFPKAAHDDMVDTTSMMVAYFSKHMKIQPRIRSL